MRYWWVNHKQTFRQEFDGKYVWCPKLKTNGSVNHFYETLRAVRSGDLVFSYAFAAVQGFGFARRPCYSCPRPNEFGKVGDAWDERGWRADVDFRRFRTPIRTADYQAKLAQLLPLKYSPIKADGFGNQGAYFAEVPEPLAMFILELGAPEIVPALSGQLVAEDGPSEDEGIPVIVDWEDRQQRVIEDGDLPQTMREDLVQSRRGQGKFRKAVLTFERHCRVTRVQNPDHLIASHIKPWRESDDSERLCAGNGLMLTPSIDHLFDRGFISFEDSGDLIVSPRADADSMVKMGVDIDAMPNVGRFNSDQKHFLDYHRTAILLKPLK